MKLPSIQARLPCARNRAVLGFIGVLLAALFFIFLMGASRALAVPVVDEEDMIALLSLNLGGRDLAVAAWSNMNPSEKQTLRDQAARIATMARGAELDGLSLTPDVARALRWGIASFLADAWEKKISSETDLSESAALSFYEANSQWYVDGEGEFIPFERCKSRVRDDMIRSAVRKKLEELNSE